MSLNENQLIGLIPQGLVNLNMTMLDLSDSMLISLTQSLELSKQLNYSKGSDVKYTIFHMKGKLELFLSAMKINFSLSLDSLVPFGIQLQVYWSRTYLG